MNTSLPSGDLPPLVLIAGATASGKSALAMALADLTPAAIINADSMQVYRDLRVVTARPSLGDEACHPHRLFGTIDGAEACSAARWAGDAQAAIADTRAEGRLPILVGGTGMYIRTLLDGIAPVPEIDPAIRAQVRAMAVGDAHDALTREDPGTAARLAPADTSRVARSLEVVRSTGKTLTDWQAARVGGIGDKVRLIPLLLLPPRALLQERIDARFAEMVEHGQAEVTALLARRLDPALPVMRAIGVREIGATLTGRLTRSQAIDAGALATRQYAKRQETWFANQLPTSWRRISEPLNSAASSSFARTLRLTALKA